MVAVKLTAVHGNCPAPKLSSAESVMGDSGEGTVYRKVGGRTPSYEMVCDEVHEDWESGSLCSDAPSLRVGSGP